MGQYLVSHYKGIYRVLAEFDLETQDFIRDPMGNLDPSFDDFYIPCKAGGEIRHQGGSTLCYIAPSKQRGNNIKNKLDNISTEIIKRFVQNDLDTLIEFNAKHIDTVASVVEAKTSGNSISPFSVKNLPKNNFRIPEEEMKKYREAIKPLKGKEDIVIFRDIFSNFYNYINKKKGKKFDAKKEMRKERLKGKEFIYKIGMWDEFITFINKYITAMEGR